MLINKTIYTKIYIHVKYLEKKISFDYSSILYNQKNHNLQKTIHVIKIKNVKFPYKSYCIFIYMLGYQQIRQ